ncbi:LysR family transcriptional regulator [Paraglaciecola psychrophila]|uniref:HTH lysR-type domain-containing protein n=1 Tax=Paraglaciecola psychrophila 170 TaxID=1129794 RepID=K7AX66_9ALTE|nr:LysR family transcriptional regulator [Paraglaciecola psychrophila]AGH43615.1 hypothetical protein C427_1506 [Paraglaciecola psychrophila 170]GAC39720.1 LysR family transcriptional regulator [Paraglaciecola psychrophila 170]
MNIKSKDLNSLHLFAILYEERSLTRASARMALSQPALSHRLNKLREEFGDPMFVRASRGLTLTPFAKKYANQIMGVVSNVEAFYQTMQPPDFLQQRDKVTIYGTEIVEALLMPSVLNIIASEAPNVKIIMFNTSGRLPLKELENGTCDIAIAGFFENIPTSFYQEKIMEYEFVVLANKQNEHIGSELTLAAFLQCRHVMVTLTGALNGSIDTALESLGEKRRVLAGYSSFLAPQILLRKQKNILFVCARPLAVLAVQNNKDLIIYNSPAALPKIELIQVWHERTHNDQLRKLLRENLKNIASKASWK